jgi:outer membrane protein assembly factor BamE (lipoprotein component of BamABCDE complex)
MNKAIYCLFLIISLLFGCGKKYNIPGFDKVSWQNDKKGCKGDRVSLAKAIIKNSISLKGMDDDVLVDLLGNPEKTVYYGRNRKDYIYFVEPGSQCNSDQVQAGSRIVIEFDALGYINIVTYQNG